MTNILNIASFFGRDFDWSYQKTTIVLIIIQAVLAVVAISLIIYLIMRRKFSKQVQNTVITVAAQPAPEPTPEPQTIVVESQPQTVVVEKPVIVEKVVEVEKPVVVEVEKPVVVERPVVVEKLVEKPIMVETVRIDEESVEAGRLRYDRSFEARLIQSNDETKHWYTEIKNELLSYKGCKARISWKRETFKASKQVVAMLVYRGNTLCLFLALDPSEYVDEKYATEDVSGTPIYAETPVMIRLRNDKRVRIGKELIEAVMTQKKVAPDPYYSSQDYYVPYEGVVELINRGLIKREIRTVEEEAIFDRD